MLLPTPRPRRTRSVCCSMNARFSRPSRTMTCIIPQKERQVRAGPDGKVQVRIPRNGRHPGIDDDEFSAAISKAPDIVCRDWRAFGGIGTRDNHDVGERDVAPRIGRSGPRQKPVCTPFLPRPYTGGRCSRYAACQARPARIFQADRIFLSSMTRRHIRQPHLFRSVLESPEVCAAVRLSASSHVAVRNPASVRVSAETTNDRDGCPAYSASHPSGTASRG